MPSPGNPVSPLALTALPRVPLIKPGDDLEAILFQVIDGAGLIMQDHDVVVIAQKVVSKAEGRLVDLASVTPSARAKSLAAEVNKDPRLVEVILSESKDVVRHRRDVLVTEHKLGIVMANAGVDRSNIEATGDGEWALLLPANPDATCGKLKAALDRRYRCKLAVIISDSVGRAWRNGTIGTALGAAGLPSLRDLRGRRDLFGRVLEVSETGFADQIASAAALVMGEAAEGNPVVHVRGLTWYEEALPAAALLRARHLDLFR